MSVELANFALALTIFLSLGIFTTSIIGLKQKKPKFMEVSFSGQLAFLIITTFINFAFIRAFVGLDFSVKEVVFGSALNLNLIYRIMAAFLSPSGSFMLLLLFLSIISYFSSFVFKKLDFFLSTRTYSIISFLIFIISLYTFFFANPFARSLNLPDNGIGININLQNQITIFIPLFLYFGYALGFFLFAFTVSSLFEKSKQEWQKISFPITLCLTLIFLSALILLILWNYNNIGWLSWWNWNSIATSILTIVTALLALSLILYVNITKNCLYKYSLVLSLTSFFFILFSLFSLKVKIFASNPFQIYPLSKTPLLILLLLPVLIGVITFIKKQNHFVKEDKDIYIFSYQGLAVISSFSLCTIAGILFFAAVYPSALSFILKTNIGYLSDDFYNFSLAPFIGIIVSIIFFFNIQKPTLTAKKLIHNESIILGLSLLAAVIAANFSPHKSFIKTLFFSLDIFLCLAALGACLKNIVNKNYKLNNDKNIDTWRLFISIFQSGLVLVIISGTLMASYKKEALFSIDLTDDIKYENLSIELKSITPLKNKDYLGSAFNFELTNPWGAAQKVTSELRLHKQLKQISHKAAIYRGFIGDIKIYATNPDSYGNIEVRLMSKPCALWLHLGLVLMLISGLLIFRKTLSLK
ncbi:MAG: cytochrome c-type biogenesis CcmF C-terminal domain-containing protein [Alphaproteobacteria bacterium]